MLSFNIRFSSTKASTCLARLAAFFSQLSYLRFVVRFRARKASSAGNGIHYSQFRAGVGDMREGAPSIRVAPCCCIARPDIARRHFD